MLAKRSIYFDLDSYIVKDDFRPLIEAHARYLTTNKARKIGTTLRKIVSHLPYVAGTILVTEEPSKVKWGTRCQA